MKFDFRNKRRQAKRKENAVQFIGISLNIIRIQKKRDAYWKILSTFRISYLD